MKDPLIFILHIRDSIKKIQKFVKGLSQKEFLDTDVVQDAVVRRIEVIGEAVKNLPEDFKEKHSHIPWKDIAGMRDKLTHHYFGVDLNKVWKVIKEDLVDLFTKINKIIEESKNDGKQ